MPVTVSRSMRRRARRSTRRLDVRMASADSTRLYAWTLLFIGSLIFVVGVFGETETGRPPVIAIALACAVAGWGVLRAWPWAKWLAIFWGPLAGMMGVIALWMAGRTISLLEYAA